MLLKAVFIRPRPLDFSERFRMAWYLRCRMFQGFNEIRLENCQHPMAYHWLTNRSSTYLYWVAKSSIFRSYKDDSLMVYPFIHWCLKNEAPPIPRDHRFAKSRSLGLNFIGKRMTINQRRNRCFCHEFPHGWFQVSVVCQPIQKPETFFEFHPEISV